MIRVASIKRILSSINYTAFKKLVKSTFFFDSIRPIDSIEKEGYNNTVIDYGVIFKQEDQLYGFKRPFPRR